MALWDLHAQVSDLVGDKFEATAKFNKTLGNKLITVASLPGEMRNSREAVKKTANLFDQIANKLKAYGIMLAYHDHAGDFTMVDGEMFWPMFFDDADSDVKVQFDIGNAMEAGQQAASYLTKYPGRVVPVHALRIIRPQTQTRCLAKGTKTGQTSSRFLRVRTARGGLLSSKRFIRSPLSTQPKSVLRISRN